MSQTEVQLIKTNAVQTGDIANSAVTDEKIAGLTSSKLTGALPAISGASLTNLPPSGKASNLIINGDMRIAVRATSSTSNGYQTLDRYKMESSNITHNSTKSRQDLSSSDTGPWEAGFRNYARIALAQAGVVAANSGVEIQQRIEAQNIATSGWNYGSASSNITLQFWFRCSTNQTFYGYLYTFDGTPQVYTFSFTASANNTWTKITKTIPGNSNLTFNNDTGPGLQLKLIAFYGTDYTNNKTLDQWAAYDGANQMPDMASTWLTAGASTFDVTGIQIEIGDSATDFEHLTFDENLSRCQRYFIKHTLVSGAATAYNAYSDGYRWWVSFSKQMRDTPTMTSSGGGDGGSNASFNIVYVSKEGYTARIESTTTSSQVVWYYGATVLAVSEI